MRSSLLWKLSTQNEKDWNAMHVTRLEKDNKEEINKGLTTDSGVGASSLEIRTGFPPPRRLPCGY